MTYNKPMEIAKIDLKMALKVRYVKYSLIGTGLFGPIIVILLIVSLVSIMPATELALMMPFMGILIAPMLGIFAVIPTTLISANALVGERELKTMEPLLCTPLTDRELLWGKTLSSVIPSLAILFGSVFATLIASLITFMVMGVEPVPVLGLSELFMLFTAGPLMIFAVVAFMIIISSKVTRVYEAYQSSSAVVMIFMIPMFVPLMNIGEGLPTAESGWLGAIITAMIAAVMFVVCWSIAFKLFNRDRLVSMV